MKYQTGREYLESLHETEKYVQQKRENIAIMKDDAAGLKSIDFERERIQSSGSPDILAVRVARYVDAEAELVDHVRRLIYKRHNLINQIQQLETREHTALLFKRYVEYKGFQTIAQEMEISYDHARRLHGHALLAFESLIME